MKRPKINKKRPRMVHFRKRSKLGKYCFSPKPSKTNFKMKKVWHQIKHKSQRRRRRRCAQSVERQKDRGTKGKLEAGCPDWAINWTLGNFLKSLATIKLPKSPTFFFVWMSTFMDIWRFFLVTLIFTPIWQNFKFCLIFCHFRAFRHNF